MTIFFDLRTDYNGEELNLSNIPSSPYLFFNKWVQPQSQMDVKDPNVMILSTSDTQNSVHSRVVLMKEFSENGLVFFSNYQNAKGKQLDEKPNASVLFYWKELYRQVRAEGQISENSNEESDKYFKSKPYDSKINTIVSQQSSEIESTKKLNEAAEAIKEKFGKKIPIPSYWGEYRIEPNYYEFWQGQANRLHDRIEYTPENQLWVKKYLAP